MPDTKEKVRHDLPPPSGPSTNGGAEIALSPTTQNNQEQDIGSASSRTESEHRIPYPFESQSGLDEEIGDGCKLSACIEAYQ